MNYAAIKKTDIANGPGIRVSLFVSGCRHACKGCFNREAWSFTYGLEFDDTAQRNVIDALDHEYIAGLSLLGGEPFEPENQYPLVMFLENVRRTFPHKTVWCYSGFTFEELYSGTVGEYASDLLSHIDVLVDGRFEQDKTDLSLLFRGSDNQRILDVKRSLAEGRAVWLGGVWKRTMGSGNIEEDEPYVANSTM